MKNTVKDILKIMLTVLLAVVVIPSSARTIEAAEQSETITVTSGTYGETNTWTGTYFSVSGYLSTITKATELSKWNGIVVSSNSGENQKSIKKITLNHTSAGEQHKDEVSTSPVSTPDADHTTYTFTGEVTSVTFSSTSVGADVTSVIVYYDDGSTSTYSVTLSGGANATASGSTSQTVTAGQAMTTVTYTASTNYCFDEFTDIESNGVKAVRTDSTTVTVSGIPTGDVSITVPDAVAAVASITNGGVVTYYNTIKAATDVWWSMGGGTTLTLLSDLETTKSIDVNGGTSDNPKILDLNGHGILYKDSSAVGSPVIFVNSGTFLEIKDSNPTGTHYVTLNGTGRASSVSGTSSEGAKEITGGYIAGGYDGTGSSGGGVWIEPGSGLTMSGGTIIGNIATNSAGVYVSKTSSFTMSGGTIKNNKASSFGGGVYVNGGTFNLSGNPVIKDNLNDTDQNNVYLEDGKTITVNGALKSAASIGVTMRTAGIFTSSSDTVKVKDYKSNFSSDDNNYSVSVSGNELTLTNEKQIQATVTGYSGTYDGQAHGISVTVTDPSSGAVIKYGTSEGTYNLDNSPTITDVSDSPKTYYYKITADGYADKTGSADVTISKATNTVTVDIEGWTYGQTAKTPSSTATYGTATYTYKEEGSSIYSGTVPTKAGTHTVKASVAASGNYAAGEATKDFTIAKADPSTLVPEGYVINAEVLDTLGNLTLPEGLEWVNLDTVISAAGTNTYPVKAKDTKNYTGETNITVKASYASYSYVEGSSSCQWTKGTSGTLPFTFKRSINDEKTLDSFSKASTDGKDMTQGVQYTIEKGSLKIYLKDSMLNTLSVGTHVLKVTFKDGEATTTFRVIEKSSGGGSSSKDYNPPKTGIE